MQSLRSAVEYVNKGLFGTSIVLGTAQGVVMGLAAERLIDALSQDSQIVDFISPGNNELVRQLGSIVVLSVGGYMLNDACARIAKLWKVVSKPPRIVDVCYIGSKDKTEAGMLSGIELGTGFGFAKSGTSIASSLIISGIRKLL